MGDDEMVRTDLTGTEVWVLQLALKTETGTAHHVAGVYTTQVAAELAADRLLELELFDWQGEWWEEDEGRLYSRLVLDVDAPGEVCDHSMWIERLYINRPPITWTELYARDLDE